MRSMQKILLRNREEAFSAFEFMFEENVPLWKKLTGTDFERWK